MKRQTGQWVLIQLRSFLMDPIKTLTKVGLYLIPFLFSLCFHEYAHGWMARKKGDKTAELMGRLTLNPFAHADLIGTFVLPIASIVMGFPFFGWAKPVPVNSRNLRNPVKDMFWISLAGPMSNVILASIGSVVLVVTYGYLRSFGFANAIIDLMKVFIPVNLFLAFFNLIPLHPLDGGKILARFLSPSLNQKLEEHENMTGMLLMLLAFSGALGVLAIPVYKTFELMVGLAERVFI